jgi:phage gp16-like protein
MIDRTRAIAAIHVAKKQAALDDDAYRDLMQRETGKRSSADLDERGLRKMLVVLDGLKPEGAVLPSRYAVRKDPRPIARKVVALWLMLWNLDEVQSRGDKSIDAFVRRTTGKSALKFTTNGEAGKVVEALKAWCLRAGVDADTTAGLFEPLRALVFEQGRRLADAVCDGTDPAQLAALTLYAPRVRGRVTLGQAELQALANDLGFVIRKHRLGERHRRKSPSQQPGETS